jgi:mRNA-degrading endonuclease toxin of MazEF toxin-antitoxin module
MFAMPRPALVIADGPFAEVAWESGVEVVALAGLDRLALAVATATARRETGVVVPLCTDRAARAYRVLEELVAGGGTDPEARAPDHETGL